MTEKIAKLKGSNTLNSIDDYNSKRDSLPVLSENSVQVEQQYFLSYCF
jgi:hypothetical protein